MKKPNRYNGINPIPGQPRYGHKNEPTQVLAQTEAPANEAEAAARAAVAISSIHPMPAALANANIETAKNLKSVEAENAKVEAKVEAKIEALSKAETGAEAKKVDPLANVKSGAQILADTSAPAASKRPAS